MHINILSHRGFWKNECEKNSFLAFKRSFDNGFGVETDLRDFGSKIVISHDPPKNISNSFEGLLELHSKYSSRPTLALNIKADGLSSEVKTLLSEFNVSNYFVFDMSVPDCLSYLKQGVTTFGRQSEFELAPPFYDHISGVWLDEFNTHWVNENVLNQHLDNNKAVCIVSPELHNRSYLEEWRNYKSIFKSIESKKLMLCTDYPDIAQEYFYG